MNTIKFPIRYIPKNLTSKDKQKQFKMLNKSKKMYKKKQYYNRPLVSSYKSKPSSHIANARKIYNIENIAPTPELAEKTGCKLSTLNEIVRKGEGLIILLVQDPTKHPNPGVWHD